MARSIDYANLSEDDFQYLSDRHWLIAEGDYQGFKTSAAVEAWRNGETIESDDDEEEEEEEIDLDTLNVDDLKGLLKEAGLPTDGKKQELIDRLLAAQGDDEEDDEEDA